MALAGSILDHAWRILRTDGSSTDVSGLQEDFLLTLLYQACMRYERRVRKGGSGSISSMREDGFDLVSETAINDASGVDEADASITVDTHAFPDSAGAAVIWDDNMPDIFKYTGQTSTSFTGVTGLSFDHDDNDSIQPLYKLPTNFKKFRPSQDYGDGCRVNGQPYRFMEGPPRAGYFSMYDDGTSKYLWLPRNLTGNASILFEKTTTVIDDTGDVVEVPEEHIFFLVWEIVKTATIPKEGGQPSQLYTVAKMESSRELREAIEDKNTGKGVRVKQFYPNRIPRDPSLFNRVPR